MSNPQHTNLHRNNPAEWVMWTCLLPAFAVAWLLEWRRTRHVGRMCEHD